MTISYTKELFFNTYSNNKRVLLFLNGNYVSLTQNKFFALPDCRFIYFGVEWQIKNNSVSKI